MSGRPGSHAVRQPEWETEVGRQTSEELSEIRTVLSRAEDARKTLIRYRDGHHMRAGHWEYDGPGGRGRYVGGTTEPDPDVQEMIDALGDAIDKLDRWRRTGRPRQTLKPSRRTPRP
jgi:hypothetical protein